jgi:hypothetical protein
MSTAIETIRARERAVITAILNHDVAALEELVASGFVYTASEIGRRTRQEWLDAMPDYRMGVLEIVEMEIEVFGQVGVVHARIRQDAMIHGHHRLGYFLITDVWVHRDDSWQLASRTAVADRNPPRQ